MLKKIIPMLLGLTSISCDLWPIPVNNEFAPIVCLQITETQDRASFDKFMAELSARGIKSTILVDADFIEQNCDRVKALANNGFEIMAFACPESTEGQIVTMSMLSYEEQQELISGVKTAIETCLGESITGFRPYRFDQNKDTYAIANLLGLKYNLGCVAHTAYSFPGHEEDTLPYKAPGYEFWAVPIHSVYVNDRWTAFCDMPFNSLDAADWEALLKSELDSMIAQQHPLLVEFHPYYSGVDEGRFKAFVNFLDYALDKQARFLTVEELVQWSTQ